MAVAVQKDVIWFLKNLALSPLLNKKAFPSVELNLEDALKFLSKENLIFESGVPLGYLLLIFKGAPLGFVKNLGRRSNNLHPLSRRIRILPD